jgi:2-polyprenyl-6-methoxyphenol hydroxylase-like FAD-dependent oxidoreductase
MREYADESGVLSPSTGKIVPKGTWDSVIKMSKILVLGGGVIGLSTAMMLVRRGYNVTVLERDSAPLPGSPEEAWQSWERTGVVQFRQPHNLHPTAIQQFTSYLPDVKPAMVRAGCITLDALAAMPASIVDRTPRDGDERFLTLTGRRPTIEYALASVAEKLLPIRRGIGVTSLLTGTSASKGIPHVTGVRTTDGEDVSADLVIDATGRASKLPDWLKASGARCPIEEAEDSGFIYYSRFFRSRNGTTPAFRTGRLTHFHSFSLLTSPGDAGTWSVTVFISSGDQELKRLRDPKHWENLVAACPLHSHWLDGEPMTGVLPMGGVIDRFRRFVVEGSPVATGIVSVGDSWACTNPSLGRGITMGLMHAFATVDVVGEHLDNPLALARAHDFMTETRVTPWYRNTVEIDRGRIARYGAAIKGQTDRTTVGQTARVTDGFAVAMMYDADLFRAWLEILSMQTTPQKVMARPGVVDRIMEIARTRDAVTPPGPSREELLWMLQSGRREPRRFAS